MCPAEVGTKSVTHFVQPHIAAGLSSPIHTDPVVCSANKWAPVVHLEEHDKGTRFAPMGLHMKDRCAAKGEGLLTSCDRRCLGFLD